jgi:hypothetical protein
VNHAVEGSCVWQWPADIEFEEGKPGMVRQVGEVPAVSGEEVIGAHHGVSIGEDAITQVRRNKTGCTRNEKSQNPSLTA